MMMMMMMMMTITMTTMMTMYRICARAGPVRRCGRVDVVHTTDDAGNVPFVHACC